MAVWGLIDISFLFSFVIFQMAKRKQKFSKSTGKLEKKNINVFFHQWRPPFPKPLVFTVRIRESRTFFARFKKKKRKEEKSEGLLGSGVWGRERVNSIARTIALAIAVN